MAPGWIHLDASLNAFFASWPRPVLGWLHRLTDSRNWYSKEEYVRLLGSHRFVHHDVRRGLPFADASVDIVYSSHMLEHLGREEARGFLAEAHRVLRPGGLLRICVPDLDHVLGLFAEGERERALGYFFLEEFQGDLGPHRWLYDEGSLGRLMKESGFCEIGRAAYRQGRVPDLEILDNWPEETLYMEAVRGGGRAPTES